MNPLRKRNGPSHKFSGHSTWTPVIFTEGDFKRVYNSCVKYFCPPVQSSSNTTPGISEVTSSISTGVRFLAEAGNFSLRHRVQTGSGAHTASYPMGTGVLSPEVKRPGHEVDHSPASSAEVKNVWGYTSTLPYALMWWCLVKYRIRMGWYLVKHRENFTFTLLWNNKFKCAT
jgi:hypothetical protein